VDGDSRVARAAGRSRLREPRVGGGRGGAALLLPYGWQLSGGAILPSPLSHNGFGVCVELTRVPEFEGPPRERLIRPMPVRN
jgi:hypothetical protein